MEKKCPECKEDIDILLTQPPSPPSTQNMMTNGTFTVSTTAELDYPSTRKIYKCSNPKCWVTKVTELWE